MSFRRLRTVLRQAEHHVPLRAVDALGEPKLKRVKGPPLRDIPGAQCCYPLTVPEPSPAGWHPDPCDRHEHRYWDGGQWTEHVSSGGHQGVDAPVDKAVAPAIDRLSTEAERQARKAGAGHDGGGTLFTEQVLIINQKTRFFGSTLEYAVYNQNGQQVGSVQ